MPHPLIRPVRPRRRRLLLLPESLQDALSRFVDMAVGSGMIAAAVLITLAIATYHPSDPSWNTAGNTTETLNLLGHTGSTIADILWQFFGLASLVISIVLAAWGWRIATARGLDLLWWRLGAMVVTLFAAASVLAAVDHKIGSTIVFLGGAFGKIITHGLIAKLPIWARYIAIIVLAQASLLALYMAAALSLSEWHVVAKAVHRGVMWCLWRVHHFMSTTWEILRKEKSGAVYEEEDIEDRSQKTEDIEEEEETEGDEEVAPKRVISSPLIKRPAASARQARLALRPDSDHSLPPLELLQWPDEARNSVTTVSEDALEKNAKMLESVLSDFGVHGAIIKVSPGPVVTLYELEPSPGTRAARVISLADDIARNMSAISVRVAVVPGRNVIGIELPNFKRETVYLRELLSSDAYNDTKANLPLVLGKDIAGQPVIADLARMPHLLIAGTTGSGKSVGINTMILSLLYRLPPQKCRFIMIDPKMLELSVYEGIPHLLAPVVTEPKKAIMALRWTVREMEERYRAMSKLGVRNIEGYNMRLREAAKNGENLTRTVQTGFDRETGKPIYEEQPLDLTELPFIVVIVDEMADLMIVAGKEIESAIQRLAQMARAAGIHIVMATQRPSVDVITGTIKANFPTRISFQVTSKIDSRTILSEQGAEQLLGQGDMLYMAGGGRVTRVHGPFVRDDEVESIVKFLKSQGEPEYLDEVTEDDGRGGGDIGDAGGFSGGGGEEFSAGGNTSVSDALYDKAVDIVLRERKASTSFIQRQLQLGYNKAANLVERMEREGLIGPANAMGKRDIYGRGGGEEG